MKKVLLSLFVLAGTAFTCFAQQALPPEVSLGANVGQPVGQTADVYKYTIGFEFKLEMPTKIKGFQYLGSVGFSDYPLKRKTNTLTEHDFITAEVGAKYHFNKWVYVEGEVGGSMNINDNYPGQKIGLLYAPVMGISIPTIDYDHLDVGVRYEGRVASGNTVNIIGLVIAYRLEL